MMRLANNRLWLCLIHVVFSKAIYAEANQSTPQQGLTPFIPLLMIFGIFYFLVIRPQQRKAKHQQKYLSELKRGDLVITSGGIIGTIRNLNEKFVTLEIDEGVCLKILRSQISEGASTLKEESKAKAPALAKEEPS